MNRAGADCEDRAARHLEQAGLQVVARNFRSRFGEIDLIARDHDMLVFVEVRARSRSDFGGAAESITAAKRERLRLTAQIYLSRLPEAPPCRFDVVLVSGPELETIEWLVSAWE